MNFIKISKKYSSKFSLAAAVFVLISVLAGLYFRLKGLDKWPFAVDEYYFTQSVKNILKNGLPEYASGGYYSRGIVQQYLTALLLLLGIKAELASRLFPLISNLLAILGIYLLGKKVSGKTVAAALVVIFSLSVWEVEFARFARMYSLFQSIFIWYLYFLYKNAVEADPKALKWVWVLSFLSIFVFEGSIFLVGLNFLVLFWDSGKNTLNPFLLNSGRNMLNLIIPLIIFIAGFVFLTFDFRSFNGRLSLPPDVLPYYQIGESEPLIRKPVLLISSLPSSLIWPLLFLIPLSLNIYLGFRILKSRHSILFKTGLLVLLLFSLLNLLGLLIVSFLIFFLIGWLDYKNFFGKNLQTFQEPHSGGRKKLFPGSWEKFSSVPIYMLAPTTALNLLFWIAFAAGTTEWHRSFPLQNISGFGSAVKVMLKDSLNYPYFYETFVLFRDTMPLLTFTVLFLITFLIFYLIIKNEKNTAPIRFILFLFLVLILAVDILNLSHFDTRYFFFLYPMILLLSVSCIELIINSIFKRGLLKEYSMAAAIILFLFISEDFNLKHLFNIDSREINFRVNFNLAQKVHFYPRWDTRTPAEFINKNVSRDDLVITNEQVNDFYLKKLDYVYIDYRGRLNGVSVYDGEKELWTNAKLIYRDNDLINLILNEKKNKWVIINTLWGTRFLKQDNFFTDFRKYAVYANPDSSAIVYKFPANLNGNGKRSEIRMELNN